MLHGSFLVQHQRMLKPIFIFVGLSVCVFPCGADESWNRFVSDFLEQSFKATPQIGIYVGRHEYDGQFQDFSAKGLKQESQRLKVALARARAFEESKLSSQEKFERSYLMAEVRRELFWLDVADFPHHNPAYYFDNGLDPSIYTNRPYASVDVRLKAYVKYLRGIPKVLGQMRANLKTPLSPSYIKFGESAFEGFAEYYLNDGKKAFSAAQDTRSKKEMDDAAKTAAGAMRDTVKWLKAQTKSAKPNFALGAQRLSQMLKDTEMVDVPLERLHAIGEADLKRNQKALAEACSQYAPHKSIEDCVAKMGADKPKGGAVEAARAQLSNLKAFIRKHDLVSIPSNEDALVAEAPTYNRQNAAYIDIVGPYEKNLPSVYNIAPPDPAWKPEVRDAFLPGKAVLLFTSVHEVWPGHFLQFLHAKQSKSMFGRVYVGYVFAEGWAHYGEEMMWEAGLSGGDPEMHVGQLSDALLRDCRFLSAIGLHTGKMTEDESKALFKRECHQDEGNAIQQAARGTYDPAYLNYTLGKLMIRKLREDWTAKRGGRKAWKEFHDQFLSYGGPPIPLVRQQMLGGDAKAVF